MSEYQIIRFCAPTLAGLKTASLFCCDAPDEAELLGQLRHWNTSLAPKGCGMLPLRIWNGRALIYLYRPKRWRATWPVRMRPACSTAAVTMARSLPAACAA